MNYRIELLPCPMQENDRLARHMMQRAQQGGLCRARHNPPYDEINVMSSCH